MGWMITCKEATLYISQKEEGKLSWPSRIKLWKHLVICSICRLFAKQNDIIIKNACSPENKIASLSAGEKREIVELLQSAG